MNQLRSSGFSVLHIGYGEVVSVFAGFGIDVEADEGTSDDYLRRQVASFDALGVNGRSDLASALRATAPKEFLNFREALERTIMRTVGQVVIVPLFGDSLEFTQVTDAIASLRSHRFNGSQKFVRFEISIRYSNGDEIRASFREVADAIEFLETFDG